jgi:glutamate dehydrogenase/leucine dehydrogenase
MMGQLMPSRDIGSNTMFRGNLPKGESDTIRVSIFDEMRALAVWMTWKSAIVSILFGGRQRCGDGKPVELGGSLGRFEATSRGRVITSLNALKYSKKSIEGATVAIQGCGNVGGVTVSYFKWVQNLKELV